MYRLRTVCGSLRGTPCRRRSCAADLGLIEHVESVELSRTGPASRSAADRRAALSTAEARRLADAGARGRARALRRARAGAPVRARPVRRTVLATASSRSRRHAPPARRTTPLRVGHQRHVHIVLVDEREQLRDLLAHELPRNALPPPAPTPTSGTAIRAALAPWRDDAALGELEAREQTCGVPGGASCRTAPLCTATIAGTRSVAGAPALPASSCERSAGEARASAVPVLPTRPVGVGGDDPRVAGELGEVALRDEEMPLIQRGTVPSVERCVSENPGTLLKEGLSLFRFGRFA